MCSPIVKDTEQAEFDSLSLALTCSGLGSKMAVLNFCPAVGSRVGVSPSPGSRKFTSGSVCSIRLVDVNVGRAPLAAEISYHSASPEAFEACGRERLRHHAMCRRTSFCTHCCSPQRNGRPWLPLRNIDIQSLLRCPLNSEVEFLMIATCSKYDRRTCPWSSRFGGLASSSARLTMRGSLLTVTCKYTCGVRTPITYSGCLVS